MTNFGRLSHYGRAAIAALFLGLATGAPAYATQIHVLAQDASTVTAKVTDGAGVFSSSQAAQLEEKITQLQQNTGDLLYIVTIDTAPGGAVAYAEQIRDTRGTNVGAVVIDTTQRQLGVAVGEDFRSGDEDTLTEAALPDLGASEWFAGANAAVKSALSGNRGSAGNSGASGEGDQGGALWLGAGAAAVAVAGGGIWAATKRKGKKDRAIAVSNARAIEPGNTNALSRQSTDTLEKLAAEELVSTDESIRRGKEELDIAIAEFGPERTRQFTAAMNHSRTTLQRAFAMKQQLETQGHAMGEQQRRQLLVNIISSCGQADDALDAKAAEFADMRNLLVMAPQRLDQLTQQTIDVRARLPRAEETVAKLHQEFDEAMLRSVADNPEMATVSVSEAEKSLGIARELASKPAGQQGGLVAAIRDTEHAIDVADRLLNGVENARSNIMEAKSLLPALIEEVEGEIAEARQLEAQGAAQGTKADWGRLEQLLATASTGVQAAREGGKSDPLTHHTELTNIDTELDAALDQLRHTTHTHAQQLHMFSQQIGVAETTIQAAEDLIASRGRLIGASARTALADSKRLHAQALQARDRDTRQAVEYARDAVLAAQTAQRRAQDDIDNYRRRQQRQQMSNAAGNVITGMVIGQMLGGGRRSYGGGFGGGFGGGGFGGGGFGGGGGGSRGSAF
ncbi:chromosome partitioning protein ParA [Corynebacterium phocae]|uniref:Chromosome partitioning protein ParA n=1 Tax=Corynebacterium phocae TaxID=161895 RepID=A0A1L7D222_9CORY|nr:TPM domain-containing protein [Corynebacterium phocae]APT92123.1 chromosome partitioning protein ParA [Corynebacterium phocae]KAA8726510.1 TPM domain-containing protein [Corynebacterium phocae]